MNIPSQIRNGDSISWKDKSTFDNLRNPISAPAWTLNYAIRGAVNLDLVATQDGTGWITAMTATQSTTLTAGDYYWQAFATNGAQKVTVGNGKLVMAANLFAATAGAELRSQTKQDLDAVQAAMRTMISGGAIVKYVIGNRQVEKMAMADLIILESKLKVAYAREQRASDSANGLGNPNSTFVRF